MRLGFSIGTLGSAGGSPADQVRLVREAERIGYDSVWASEGYGADPAVLMAWLAAHTHRIGLGTGVLQISARTAMAAAMAAITIDQVSHGRFRLGVGPSGPQTAEGWHGQRYDRPLDGIRDYVAVLRLALARQEIRYSGPTLTLPLPDSQGEAPAPDVPPVQARLPIYLAAIGPRAIALAGAIADGWLAIHTPPEHLAACCATLKSGADRALRSLAGFDVASMVLALVDDDLDRARDMMRPTLATYIGGMGSRGTNSYNRLACDLGFEQAASAVQEAYLDGRQGEAIERVPDELIDQMTLCGPEDRIRERVEDYQAAGTSTLIVGMVMPGVEDRLAQLRLLAELAP